MKAHKIRNLGDLPDVASIRAQEVSLLTSYAVSSVWRRAKDDPTFPQPRKLGARLTVWNLGEVRRWMATR
ncbi:MAG: AlpA family phage regulatory protein [Candidatus Accumulibacter sp.]|jgi:predicted DNA-binding transcriptional regulator AlpA|nr:AlpA family phage regulatory protein [Candidatus Accumulibacter conexus]